MEIDRETFEEQRSPRFGRANPQRMRLAFWEAMVKDGGHPHKLRRLFGLDDRDGKPIWCFNRLGQSETETVDGRTVCIGGEYDDASDPDFFIYNDVVILGPDKTIEIYGYPKEVFPPTDFHTASLVGNRIVIIGCIGYLGERRPGVTPVWSLDLSSYHIEPVATQGEPPGWIFEHEAEVDPSGDSITVRGGKMIVKRDGREVTRLNLEEYRLNLGDGCWERLAGRDGWCQFAIGPVDPKEDFSGWVFPYDSRSVEFWCYPFKEDVFWPVGIPHELIPVPESDARTYGTLQNYYRIKVNSVNILFIYDYDILRMIVEGDLPRAITKQVAETIHANVEAALGSPCYLREF